jgi:hypothetical protein
MVVVRDHLITVAMVTSLIVRALGLPLDGLSQTARYDGRWWARASLVGNSMPGHSRIIKRFARNRCGMLLHRRYVQAAHQN